jgi:cinnamyl-alcohol dehydrogenase
MGINGIVLPEEEHPVKAFGWAARDPSGILSPFNFSRRETGEEDVKVKVLYCGICHSDLHNIKNERGTAKYPMVPGHEMTGEVIEVGSKVRNFKVGDKAAVGVIIGSCGSPSSCQYCAKDLENYCSKRMLTYNSAYYDGTWNYGGYSDIIVVNEHFVYQIPSNLPLDATASLLCAGITTYSPLRYFELDKPGLSIAVVGLGGLGHMAVKFAKAFGAKVTVISRSLSKKKEAIEHLGADSFLISSDADQMQAATGTFDGIIDTVSALHPIMPLISLLKQDGKLVLLGSKTIDSPVVIGERKVVGTSVIGSVKETQEMLDFCAKHDIVSDIELIQMDYVNTAMERLEKADVKYRFVIDVGNSLKTA